MRDVAFRVDPDELETTIAMRRGASQRADVGADAMTIAIDVGSCVSAAERLRDINLDLAAAYDRFVTELAGCGGIAGSDAPAADFAAAYDDAAGAGVWAYMDVVAASGTLSQLVEISARNHATADLGSMLLPGGFMYEPDVPLPEGLPAKVWQSTPPSLEGGDGRGPDWWHWVADQVGHLYPDADCDELKELGRRWTDEASTLDDRALECRLVADAVALQCSWEVNDAVASCIELGDQLGTLATTFRQLGEMCTTYADQVEEVREEIADIAKELLWWTIGTQIVTHGAAFLTVGFAEAPGQAYQVARVAIAAKKIRDVLAGLVMWSVTKRGPLNMVGREAASVSVVAQRLARARPTLATGRLRALGPPIARSDLNAPQLRNLKRFLKSNPKAEEVVFAALAAGAVKMSLRVPGRVPGSAAIWTKIVDAKGITVSCKKTTITPWGSRAHTKGK